MYKAIKNLFICAAAAVLFWCILLLTDMQTLHSGIIRFHVVANSDSAEDQEIKLSVRDAVLQSIQSDLHNISDVDQAKAYLLENIQKIELVANETLESLGYHGGAEVSLQKEHFGIRHYDTFSLPSGIYDSLRIIIGEGKGQNWWCVTFPALCTPATTQEFDDAAVAAGLSEPLSDALTNPHEVRFFFLDQLGRLENILFQE